MLLNAGGATNGSFNNYDPIEDTERSPLSVYCHKQARFNNYDPIDA